VSETDLTTRGFRGLPPERRDAVRAWVASHGIDFEKVFLITWTTPDDASGDLGRMWHAGIHYYLTPRRLNAERTAALSEQVSVWMEDDPGPAPWLDAPCGVTEVAK
jgi:hypothetical protein